MKQLPTPPSPGNPVSSTLIRQLINAIRERTIIQGLNISLKRGPSGTVVNAHNVTNPSSNLLPWTFSCKEDPDTGDRTGGWKNGRLQIGYDCDWKTPDLADTDDDPHTISDCDTCDDGEHSIEIDLNQMTAKIIASSPKKESEYEKGIVRIYIGTVIEGELKYGIHMNPVCYHIL